MTIAIIWFRQDLRLSDNPALYHAAKDNKNIIPLFILDESISWSMGEAQKWWLHHSLLSLQEQFEKKDMHLVLRHGNSLNILLDICKKHNVTAVYWNRCYEPAVIKRDMKIKKELVSLGVKVQSYNGSLLYEPWEITNKQGNYFKVFTPYWKTCLRHEVNTKIVTTPTLNQNTKVISDKVDDWTLVPTKPNWAKNFSNIWQPGEVHAKKKLIHFINHKLVNYPKYRDFPEKNATTKLSPHLHFGEISPKQIWNAVKLSEAKDFNSVRVSEIFLRQLGWREFSYYLLYHFPDLAEENFQTKFDQFHWDDNDELLQLWQQGKTGYPLVDAGMRELWVTGYMHNRVRMVTASFLTKHLLIDWRYGAKWFWNTLVDADLANNSMGWQWVAGSGADAAPYYRIFNPILQAKKFDPLGEYIRHWVPELAGLPKEYIHQPWKAPSKVLGKANIILGKNYPKPIIDHDFARQRALTTYKNIRTIV